MKKGYQKDKTLARGVCGVYIGMDVHKESWHVSAHIDGEEVFHGVISNNWLSKFASMGNAPNAVRNVMPVCPSLPAFSLKGPF